jgi:hypothetical protein
MDAAARYWLPRLLFQRGLALVYLIAFLRAVKHFRPFVGEHGLLTVAAFCTPVGLPHITGLTLPEVRHKDRLLTRAAL